MKIAICHSMQFSEQAIAAAGFFHSLGHEAYPSQTSASYIGLSPEEQETLKLDHKYNHDAIREHYDVIKTSDAVLVLNLTKHDIPGYIGGNAFLEMGFAYILKKPIYLLNDIPAIPYYQTEIIAMKPIVLHGDLSQLLK